MKQRLGGLITAAGNVYTAALLGFLLLQRTPLGGAWPVRLVANFLPYLFLPLLLLVPLILFSQSRRSKIVISLPCVIFFLLYGHLFLPHATNVPGVGENTLTIMTYNVTRGAPGVEEILSIIETEDADVVALQEVSPKVGEALYSLADRYPYMAVHPTPDGYAGCAVLSRFPLANDEVYPLVVGTHLSQRVVLDLDGESIHLFSVHLQPPQLAVRRGGARFLVPAGYDTTTQDQEMARLLEELDALEGKVVVVGDFNMTDQATGYLELTRVLRDAHREAGWGFGHTFPDREALFVATPFPLMRIDYVFHSPDLTARRSYVGERGGPNHRFLVAELSF